MGMSKTGKRKLTALQREQLAIEYRLAGLSYDKVAKRLGMSLSGAYNAVDRAMKKRIAKVGEDAEKLRQMELSRLDELFLAMYPQARKGSLGAVDRCLRIMKRRSELMGLDAAQNLDISHHGEMRIEVVFEDDNDNGQAAPSA